MIAPGTRRLAILSTIAFAVVANESSPRTDHVTHTRPGSVRQAEEKQGVRSPCGGRNKVGRN
jgi:hypothetical protein